MDFIVGGVNYKAAKLPAIKQFHLIRRLAPVMANLTNPDEAIEGIANAIGELKDEEANYVLFGLLGCVEREQPPHGWAKITVGESIMFQEIDLVELMQIAAKSFQANFGDFLGKLPSDLTGAIPKPNVP